MSQITNITHLSDETLYELDKTIGQISAERPGITQHLLLGVLSEMVNIESINIIYRDHDVRSMDGILVRHLKIYGGVGDGCLKKMLHHQYLLS